ncbi:hypothetical protein R3P38DRAFT_3208599 [Favolaschia claudopus]|uniref:Uncharacterized protein n=1 Tax=Favolaschia claudopus TaxID=2862362 RepID=A0AAW0AIZ6_9AGAR
MSASTLSFTNDGNLIIPREVLVHRRHITTITAVGIGGLVGEIDWQEKAFVINGVRRSWDEIRVKNSRLEFFKCSWTWGDIPTYKFEYQNHNKELVATPTTPNPAIIFTGYRPKAFHRHATEPASVQFPLGLNAYDEIERMFVLMAMVHSEVKKGDLEAAAAAAGGGGG